jgi:hypothetical protein
LGCLGLTHQQTKSMASGTRDDVSRYPEREQAREAVSKAQEAVKLLKRARKLMTEENPAQLAIGHLDTTIQEAERHATTLGNWYWRTYGDQEAK